MKHIVFFLFWIGFSVVASGQLDSLAKTEVDLARYNDYFVNADKYSHRKDAHKKFVKLLHKALERDSSFYYPFDSLQWLSIIMPPDKSFRIFSWILLKDYDNNRYYGILQKQDGSIVELIDNGGDLSDIEYQTFDPSSWYGQLYYNVYQYEAGGKKRYILFGMRQLDKYNKVKIASPLILDDTTGSITFGQEIFEEPRYQDGYKNRLILVTRALAASTLNYDEDLGLIIYDHTIPIPDRWAKEAGFGYVPDGTYEGYYLKGDKWKYKNRIFNRKYDKPPVPKPVLDKKKKDIFGR